MNFADIENCFQYKYGRSNFWVDSFQFVLAKRLESVWKFRPPSGLTETRAKSTLDTEDINFVPYYPSRKQKLVGKHFLSLLLTSPFVEENKFWIVFVIFYRLMIYIKTSASCSLSTLCSVYLVMKLFLQMSHLLISHLYQLNVCQISKAFRNLNESSSNTKHYISTVCCYTQGIEDELNCQWDCLKI